MDEKIRGTLAGISASDDGTVATLAVIWSLKNKKSAIHVARLTIHEAGVRNCRGVKDSKETILT